MWILREDVLEGRVAEIPLAKGTVTLGRDAKNDVHLDSTQVSRFHAEIQVLRDHVVVSDAGSENGVFVNSQKVSAETRANNGDVVELGDYVFRLTRRIDRTNAKTIVATGTEVSAKRGRSQVLIPLPDGASGAEERTLGAMRAMELAAEEERATESPWASAPYLKCVEGGHVGKEFVVATGDFSIGRELSCSLPLDDPSISGQHAKLVWRRGTHHLYDSDSINGVFHNGTRSRGVPLASGDFVTLGNHTLQYVDPANPPSPDLVPPLIDAAGRPRMRRGLVVGVVIAFAVAAGLVVLKRYL